MRLLPSRARPSSFFPTSISIASFLARFHRAVYRSCAARRSFFLHSCSRSSPPRAGCLGASRPDSAHPWCSTRSSCRSRLCPSTGWDGDSGFPPGSRSRPRRWRIPALIVFALASFARIQLLVLPLAFALATALMASRERRFRRFLSQRRYLIGAGFLLAVVALVVPAGALGVYSGIRHVDLAPGGIAIHFGTQMIGLLFACSWIIVPGALIGLGLAIFRPSSRIELSFACSASIVTLGLLLQASFFGFVTT